MATGVLRVDILGGCPCVARTQRTAVAVCGTSSPRPALVSRSTAAVCSWFGSFVVAWSSKANCLASGWCVFRVINGSAVALVMFFLRTRAGDTREAQRAAENYTYSSTTPRASCNTLILLKHRLARSSSYACSRTGRVIGFAARVYERGGLATVLDRALTENKKAQQALTARNACM